jgi:hypothetical protein
MISATIGVVLDALHSRSGIVGEKKRFCRRTPVHSTQRLREQA